MKSKLKTEKIRKPSILLYWLAAYCVRPITKFYFRQKIDNKDIKGLKSPILALASHSSTMDIAFAIEALLPRRFNMVASKDLFSWSGFKPFIHAFGAIPINQRTIDLKCMRTLKNAVEQGRNVIIYPEGKTSIEGKELHHLQPNIAKFIKFLDCDVVLVHSLGAYLTKPRYFKGFRRGKVQTKVTVLMTREEVRTLDLKTLYERVCNALKFNDHIWQRENGIRFRSKNLAIGLNYILYKCPKCGTEYEMVSDERYLTCNHCGNKVEYTEYGALKPITVQTKEIDVDNDGKSVSLDRIDLWYDYQRAEVLKEIKENRYAISKKCTFSADKRDGEYFKERGEGEAFIEGDYIGYRGTMDGQPFEIKQDIKHIPSYITKNEEGIDIVESDVTYRCLFTEKKWSTKFGLIVEELFAYKKGLRE